MLSFERLLPPEDDATYVKHASLIVGLWILATAIIAAGLAAIVIAAL